MLAVPKSALRRIHASSGTGGTPTVVGYTEHDLDVWSKVMARCMEMAGVRAGMVVHNAYGYGLFTGGLGFHQGAERIGALVIPVSGGVTARQALLLRDLRGQVLCCTPSYALHIAQGLREAGIGPDELALEIGMFGAEPWTEAMRAQLEAELGLKALNIYGLSEIVGPGVAAECPEARDGLHVQEDHFLVEVVDPKTGAPLPDGTYGELVFTTLTKEALPLLRYRTGDIASADPRALRLRAHLRAHERRARPPRRHADRPRRQPLPEPDRARPARPGGDRAALPARRRAPGAARRGHRPLRAGRTATPRRSPPACTRRSASGSASASRSSCAPRRGPPQRGQGRARDRPPQQKGQTLNMTQQLSQGCAVRAPKRNKGQTL